MKRILPVTSLAMLIVVPMLLSATAAHADDAGPSVVAERRALKPGPGLYVVDTTIDVRVGRASVKNAKGFSVPGGWQPTTLEFDLWGKSDSANAIAVKWKDGAKVVYTSECSAPDISDAKDHTGGWADQEQVRCEIKDGNMAIARTGLFEAEIYLRATGKPETLLRKIAFAVGSVKDVDLPDATITYFVDHDYKLAEAVGYWDWDGSGLHLRAYTKQANDLVGGGKLRCTMNGAPMGKDGWFQPGGGMGLDIHDGGHDKHIRWIQLDASMDLPRGSGKWSPGRYECQMIHSAKVLRTIRFQLDAKLGLVTSSEQQPKPGAIVSRTTYLPDFDIPTGIDLPFSRASFGALAMSGRPWLGPVPSASSSATLLALSESVTPSSAAAAPAPAQKGKGKAPAKPKKK